MATRGFTLLELLVVMVLIGLIGGIAVPRLTNAFIGPNVRAAALEVAAGLRGARSLAVTTGAATLFRYDPTTRRITVADRRPGDPLAESLEIVFGDPDGGRVFPGIAFFPDGSSSGGLISVSQGNQRYVVAVDWLTGRSSVHAR